MEQMIYGIALEGKVFDVDNMFVVHKIMALMGPKMLQQVEPHADDGSNMMQAQRDHYDGPGEVSKQYNKARDELKASIMPMQVYFPSICMCQS